MKFFCFVIKNNTSYVILVIKKVKKIKKNVKMGGWMVGFGGQVANFTSGSGSPRFGREGRFRDGKVEEDFH